MCRNHFLLALAALLLLSCTPDPVPPGPDEGPSEVVNFYFTTSSMGLKPGETAPLAIRYAGNDYDMKANTADIFYSSSDRSIVSVSLDGMVSAVAAGTATVSAESVSGEVHSIPVRVYPEDFVPYVNPAGNELPILGWHSLLPPYITHEQYVAMGEAGFNLSFSHVWTREENIDALAKAAGTGVKLMLMDREAELDGSYLADIVATYKDIPEFAGYWLADEPAVSVTSSNATTVDMANTWSREIHKSDQSHLTYVNLLPDYSSAKWWGTSSFNEYLSGCRKAMTDINLVSYDYYPIENSGLRSSFYSNFESYRKLCDQLSLPLWAFVMSCPHRTYPAPTIGHLKFEAFTALAYGAQGIQYFTYQTPFNTAEAFGPAIIDGAGNKTETYDLAKELNAQLKALSAVFLGASSISRMFTGSLPSGIRSENAYDASRLPAPLTGVSADGEGVLISHLVNAEHEYLMIVSRSWKDSQNVSLDFDGELLQILPDGTEAQAPSSTMLDAGDMILLIVR